MFELRDYQKELVEAVWNNLDKNVVGSLPTGAGKTATIAELIRRFLYYPNTHILLMTHKRELIRQNHNALIKHLPSDIQIGIFCAGLNSKKLKQVTIASVQSLVNAKTLPNFEIILIDECHLVPHKQLGQYHKVFARFPEARIIGLTATPFRMDGGMLHEGKEKLFDALVYEAKTGDLIKQKWLSPIKARAVSTQADLSDVHIRCGEFKSDEMALAFDHEDITKAAVSDILQLASDRKSILVFCAGVEHAHHVEQEFRNAQQTSIATVTQGTPMHERDKATSDFSNRTLRILINVGIYTTGFDAPNVDCIVMLRATKSPGLYVQMLGRGLRKAEGKTNCLLLDYGGNIERHGPLDMITARRATSGAGPAPVKVCPRCSSIIFAGFTICPDCGFIFPKPEKKEVQHSTTASDLDPISPTCIEEFQVNAVSYKEHRKEGSKPCLKVTYRYGLYNEINEFVCIEHGGYPTEKARQWFNRRGIKMPATVFAAMAIVDRLLKPKSITAKKNGKYWEVISCKF